MEVDHCPHEWLLPRCGVMVHHGGAGTLSACLRAGVPSVVCSVYGDQAWHGAAALERGVAVHSGPVGALEPEQLASYIIQAGIVVSEEQEAPSEAPGPLGALRAQMAAEDGVANAIKFADDCARTFPYPWTVSMPWHKSDRGKWHGP